MYMQWQNKRSETVRVTGARSSHIVDLITTAIGTVINKQKIKDIMTIYYGTDILSPSLYYYVCVAYNCLYKSQWGVSIMVKLIATTQHAQGCGETTPHSPNVDLYTLVHIPQVTVQKTTDWIKDVLHDLLGS